MQPICGSSTICSKWNRPATELYDCNGFWYAHSGAQWAKRNMFVFFGGWGGWEGGAPAADLYKTDNMLIAFPGNIGFVEPTNTCWGNPGLLWTARALQKNIKHRNQYVGWRRSAARGINPPQNYMIAMDFGLEGSKRTHVVIPATLREIAKT